MGKPIAQSAAEIEKCAWVCRYYAEEGESLLATEQIPLEDAEARLVACPLGVIYAIMPWNFPFWQSFRAAAPALMAGNAMLAQRRPERSRVHSGHCRNHCRGRRASRVVLGPANRCE